MVSLEFFIDIILPVALWPWGRLISLLEPSGPVQVSNGIEKIKADKQLTHPGEGLSKISSYRFDARICLWDWHFRRSDAAICKHCSTGSTLSLLPHGRPTSTGPWKLRCTSYAQLRLARCNPLQLAVIYMIRFPAHQFVSLLCYFLLQPILLLLLQLLLLLLFWLLHSLVVFKWTLTFRNLAFHI